MDQQETKDRIKKYKEIKANLLYSIPQVKAYLTSDLHYVEDDHSKFIQKYFLSPTIKGRNKVEAYYKKRGWDTKELFQARKIFNDWIIGMFIKPLLKENVINRNKYNTIIRKLK